MLKSTILDYIKKYEAYIFLIFVLLNLVPLFAGRFFPVLDAPAHLYNSKLLVDSFTGSSDLINQFYQLNEIVPNLSGHAIIAVLLTFLPAHMAEKGFLLLYAISLPFSFRYLLKSTLSANVLFSYLILPFVYSYLFLLGFYNFSLSLVFLFLSLGYWLKVDKGRISLLCAIILSGLFFLTFASHLVIYGMLILFVFSQICIGYLRVSVNISDARRINIFEFLNRFKLLILTNLVPLFFTAMYFFKRPQSEGAYSYISWKERISYFTDFRPLIAFNYEIELSYTRVLTLAYSLFIVAALLLIWLAYRKQNKLDSTNQQVFKRIVNHPSLLALIICFVAMIAFLILPDSDGYGGYISVRLALVLLIFLLYWFATTIKNKWVAALCIPLSLYVGYNLNTYYSEVVKSLDKVASELVAIGNLVEPNSIILPVDVSNNWIYSHYSNYLGITHSAVVLENYEANSGYFPVNWNDNKPGVKMTQAQREIISCFSTAYPISDNENAAMVDYFFIMGDLSNPDLECVDLLVKQNNLDEIYSSRTGTLYKLR